MLQFSRFIYNSICSVKDCGPVPTVDNSRHQSGEITVGSNVTYTCNPGFEQYDGSATLRCEKSGVWSTNKPTCNSMYIHL